MKQQKSSFMQIKRVLKEKKRPQKALCRFSKIHHHNSRRVTKELYEWLTETESAEPLCN
jgi:hypothetical protein